MAYPETTYDQFTPEDISALLSRAKDGMLNAVEVINFTTADTTAQFSIQFSVKDALEFVSQWYLRFDPVTGNRIRLGGRSGNLRP